MFDRRQVLRAALFVAAAPMIVRASSLMKVRAVVDPLERYEIGADIWGYQQVGIGYRITRQAIYYNLYAELQPVYGEPRLKLWREIFDIDGN